MSHPRRTLLTLALASQPARRPPAEPRPAQPLAFLPGAIRADAKDLLHRLEASGDYSPACLAAFRRALARLRREQHRAAMKRPLD